MLANDTCPANKYFINQFILPSATTLIRIYLFIHGKISNDSNGIEDTKDIFVNGRNSFI